ncbi:MAG TPA: AarF/UbiB family protein [Gemmatimonadaceae bacterium]|nr:AarF/UbiB family protein [Gemmatimonadaceae bacterium]
MATGASGRRRRSGARKPAAVAPPHDAHDAHGAPAAHAHRRSRAAAPAGFEYMPDTPPPSLVRRFFTTHRHLAGLAAGGIVARVSAARALGTGHGLRYRILVVLAWLLRPFVLRELRDAPFPVQLRRRLELLGPTYIKLGQILSLREDILPKPVTSELRQLLNQLPVVPFDRWLRLVEADLGRPADVMFSWIDRTPLGSASIAQIHRARTIEGDEVVIKAVKPGVRETLRRDARLLRWLGAGLELPLARYEPRRIIGEFVDYTLREVDLRREAGNAEMFAANFADQPDVVFPAIYRQYSAQSVLTMQYLAGPRPDSPAAQALPLADRERLVDLGALSIIRMIYRDGFFHADLHPGNLVVLDGPKVGFIDLGMVGRLDGELRRLMLYYYYSLVTGDAESAARYLSAVAQPGRRADLSGFRREVIEISGRWRRSSSFETFSLGQLVLESLALGGQYGMFFPVELVLMVKALITFEGVGHVLLPGIDVASVSRTHVRRIFIEQFNPLRLAREELRNAPDLADAIVKLPLLITEGVHVLERSTRAPPTAPLAGVQGTLLGGFCLVAATLLLAMHGPWPVWAILFVFAAVLVGRGRR